MARGPGPGECGSRQQDLLVLVDFVVRVDLDVVPSHLWRRRFFLCRFLPPYLLNDITDLFSSGRAFPGAPARADYSRRLRR